MDESLLILIVLLGIALIIAAQGYSFIMQGRVLLDPELKGKTGGRFVYTGFALLMVGTVVAIVTGFLFYFTSR